MSSQRDLQEIFNSGEILQIKIDGTGANRAAATIQDLNEVVSSPSFINAINAYLASGNVPAIKVDGNFPEDNVVKQRDLLEGVLPSINVIDDQPENRLVTLEEVTAPRTFVDTIPQDPAPSWVEGRFWYDGESNTFSYYNDISDMTVNIGQETVIRVYNDSGATIPNGAAVRETGVNAGLPTIGLAQANLISTSIVLGVATHDIEDSTPGYITINGTVSGVDLSSIATPGSDLYLSDSVAGGYTTVAPQVASRVGTALVNTASGTILVNIDNDRVLPPAIAWMNGVTAPATITATPVLLTGYATSDSVLMTANPTTGYINVPVSGVYRVTVNFSCTFTATNAGRQLVFGIYDETDGVDLIEMGFGTGREMDALAGSFSLPVRAVNAHNLGIRISRENVNFTTFVMENFSFDIESVALNF